MVHQIWFCSLCALHTRCETRDSEIQNATKTQKDTDISHSNIQKKYKFENLSVSYFFSHVYMLFHLFCSCIFFSALFACSLHFWGMDKKKRCFSPLKPNANYLQSRNPRDKREKIGRHEMFRGVFCVSFGIFFPPHACWCWFWCFLVRNMFMFSCVFIYILFPWFSSYSCLFYFLHFLIQKTNASPDHWHVVPPLSFADKPRGKPLEVFII